MDFRGLFEEVSVHVDIDLKYMKQAIQDVSRTLGNWNPVLFFSVNRTWYLVSVAKT